MNALLFFIKNKIYNVCNIQITNFEVEKESKEYDACRFTINGKKIICRSSKITPKKVGQFVTFWKRNADGIIAPLDEKDAIDFYVINIKKGNQLGQFVFPKEILIKKRIISTNIKEGKRGFRVYPSWDVTNNKQAERTQLWQRHYFYEFEEIINKQRIKELYALETEE